MATRAKTDLFPAEDKIKTLRRLIFHEMWESWKDRDIKCSAYRDEVIRRFSYHASKRYELIWSRDKGQMSNHLSSVFTRLNSSIRAAQKRLKLAQEADVAECLLQIDRENILEEMRINLIAANHHLCPIEGYPELSLSGDYTYEPN